MGSVQCVPVLVGTCVGAGNSVSPKTEDGGLTLSLVAVVWILLGFWDRVGCPFVMIVTCRKEMTCCGCCSLFPLHVKESAYLTPLFSKHYSEQRSRKLCLCLLCAHQRPESSHDIYIYIYINLNMIFYAHVEHSPTKTIYIRYYTKQKQLNKKHHTHTRARARTHTHTHTHTHTMTAAELDTDIRMEILSEEEGFQFGIKR